MGKLLGFKQGIGIAGLPGNFVFPAFMAHGHIGIVAAQKDLAALGDDIAVAVNAGIYRGFFASGAEGFDFSNGIGQLHQPLRAGEEPGQKVRTQTET